LQPYDIWCADVNDRQQLPQSEAFTSLDMIQELQVGGESVKTLRLPVGIDGSRIKSVRPAPRVGEHTRQILDEYGIE
jgi:crotonobetainyl-CoA:carnitine CoA-transferase CaiB-like acyl-CoA transferase